MRCNKKLMHLYAVTDRAWASKKSLYEQVEESLCGGVTCLQLREKNLSDDAFLEEAVEMSKLCKTYNVPLIINDNVDVAVKCKANGIHIGQGDMSLTKVREIVGADMIIGVSVHNVKEALEAEENGADYLGVGAVFSTSTKLDIDVLSYQMLYDICHAVNIPVVAIGGINKDNILKLSGSGVDGVALVSGIYASQNIEKSCKELYNLSEKMINSENINEEANNRDMKTALSIAGSDCSGGAGIQADLKTMLANGVYGMSAITALTAQNTTGVSDILEVSGEFLKNQIDMIFTDIRPNAVKIGMVSNADLIDVIVDRLKYYGAENIVVDPVMVATSGANLMESDAMKVMKAKLLPIATVITPNIPEAEKLSGMEIRNEEDMIEAARVLNETYKCAVLLKGGHSINDANDLLCVDGEIKWFRGKRVNNSNTHGTGCTLSSAIASNLAKGYTIIEAIEKSKEYITGALEAMLDLGEGSGPMNHGYMIK